jgi:hypothetical protein
MKKICNPTTHTYYQVSTRKAKKKTIEEIRKLWANKKGGNGPGSGGSSGDPS